MGSVPEYLEHVPEIETINIYSSTQFLEPRKKWTVALLEGPCSGYLMRLQEGVSPGGVTAGLTGAGGPTSRRVSHPGKVPQVSGRSLSRGDLYLGLLHILLDSDKAGLQRRGEAAQQCITLRPATTESSHEPWPPAHRAMNLSPEILVLTDPLYLESVNVSHSVVSDSSSPHAWTVAHQGPLSM